MKTLISLVLFVTILISGCVQGKSKQAEPAPTPAETPVVEASPSPDAVPEETPVAEATPEPTPAATPEPTPTPIPYDYTLPVAESEPVDEAWFADAVMIGDSRTDGMRLYSGMRGVDFLCYKGLSVFEVMDDKQVIQTADGKKGVLQALGEKQYGKVYISLGVNELGYNYDQGYADTYSAMVDKIRQLQPDADIYLQLLIPINTQKCAETKQPYYVTNKQIGIYNDIIRKIAVEKQVYLLNVGEIYVDENGEMFYDASFDGIHFNKAGYKQWYEYLKTHTVKEDVQ